MINFDEVFNLMQISFPENEYRTYSDQKALLENSRYHIITKENEQKNIVAFLAFWSLGDFNFVEHLAVSPTCRGKGTGTKLVSEFISESSKPIILEIEPPVDDISTKRMKFYERLGFVLNEYQYFQIPLRENDSPSELKIMSYPKKLNEEEFQNVKSIIYRGAYGV